MDRYRRSCWDPNIKVEKTGLHQELKKANTLYPFLKLVAQIVNRGRMLNIAAIHLELAH